VVLPVHGENADTPSHLDAAVVQALQEADRIALVTDPYLPSLKNVESFLKILGGLNVPKEKVLFVLNRAGAEGGMQPREIETQVHFPLSMVLPNEPMLAARTTQERSNLIKTAPHSAISLRIRELTAQLKGTSTEVRKSAA
jgi:Flp pilus assembly CpaE family ATPase